MKILHVVGARPNFMKAAPVMRALSNNVPTFSRSNIQTFKPAGFEIPNPNFEISQVLVHTGQHYDANMSQVFFRQLGLPVNVPTFSRSNVKTFINPQSLIAKTMKKALIICITGQDGLYSIFL